MHGRSHENADILADAYYQALLHEVLNTLNTEGYIDRAVHCSKRNDSLAKYKNLLGQDQRIEEMLTSLPDPEYDLLQVAIKCALYSIIRIMQRYSLEFLPASHFYFLKSAIRKEFDYRAERPHKETGIFRAADKIDKQYLLDTGKKQGMTQQEVLNILPAFTMKMTTSELKFLKTGGLFSQQLSDAALVEVGEKYSKRFSVS